MMNTDTELSLIGGFDMVTEYVYRTRRCRNGYAAIVGKVINGHSEFRTSYQDGFKSRHQAYRYAKSIAHAQAKGNGVKIVKAS